jgi:hypothetical protein
MGTTPAKSGSIDLHPFVQKHQGDITGVLSCFDRMIFKGYLPLRTPEAMEGWLAGKGVLLKDFKPFGLANSVALKEQAQELARRAGRPYVYVNRAGGKEQEVEAIRIRDGVSQGLICVLGTLEQCPSFKLRYGEGRPRLAKVDAMSFLGRKLHGNFRGEVLSKLKRREVEFCIKHRLSGNWIKMYGKFGRVLRIETVINRPYEFRVRRRGKRGGKVVAAWLPMGKGVANLYRYQEVQRGANRRYLEALAAVENPGAGYRARHRICEPVSRQAKRFRGLNPLRSREIELFGCLASV